jgi:uncharacterized protein (DUF488 family)
MSGGATALFSVGHGARAADAFVGLLREAGVGLVVDVRVAPGSRRHPHFSRAPLGRLLTEAGIAYEWRGTELGGFRTPKPDSPHTALPVDAFRGYADHMETETFGEALAWLLRAAAERPTAMMCAESDWRRCHRRLIADAAVVAGTSVVHLVDGGAEQHAIDPDARVDGGRLVYDGAQARLA